jgi:hypothetical protein
MRDAGCDPSRQHCVRHASRVSAARKTARVWETQEPVAKSPTSSRFARRRLERSNPAGIKRELRSAPQPRRRICTRGPIAATASSYLGLTLAYVFLRMRAGCFSGGPCTCSHCRLYVEGLTSAPNGVSIPGPRCSLPSRPFLFCQDSGKPTSLLRTSAPLFDTIAGQAS